MDSIIVIIIFIVSLVVIVSLHELGHFLAARRAKVKVEEFGIGLPPRIFGIKRGDTVYSLNAIPLGAFVKTPGENDPAVPDGLAGKGPWTRLGVYAAGPLINIFLAFILLNAFFMLPSSVVAGNGVMVHTVVENSPAEEAGIKAGDIILEVNGSPIHTWGDMQNMINSGQDGEEMAFLLQRDGSQSEHSLKPAYDPALGRRTIGVLLCWNMVSQVQKDSLAEEAGIRTGDTILSINGQPVYSSESLSSILSLINANEKVDLILLRGQEAIETSLIKGAEFVHQLGGMQLNWVDGLHIEQQRLPVWKAVYLGGSFVIHTPSLIIDAIPLLKEDPSLAMVGPIGAGQLTIELVRSFGFSNMLFMAGFLSLAIGLFNLIPIPPLDGGGMLVGFVEGIRRGKRLSPRAVKLAYTIGTAFLITLMVVVTFSDIHRLVSGGGFGI